MTNAEFEEVFQHLIDECQDLLIAKNEEYARGGDKLSNFKKAAGRLGVSPEMALLGMENKHSISIADMVQDIEKGEFSSIEKWEEKIVDEINYMILLYALVVERQKNFVATLNSTLNKEV